MATAWRATLQSWWREGRCDFNTCCVRTATISRRALVCACEQTHTNWCGLPRFPARVAAHLGRFLPRLGPFPSNGLFFRRPAQFGATSICPHVRPALRILQLLFVQCIANYCGAVDERLACLPQPSLGVSSLDLGRSKFGRPLFFSGGVLDIPCPAKLFQYSAFRYARYKRFCLILERS